MRLSHEKGTKAEMNREKGEERKKGRRKETEKVFLLSDEFAVRDGKRRRRDAKLPVKCSSGKRWQGERTRRCEE